MNIEKVKSFINNLKGVHTDLNISNMASEDICERFTDEMQKYKEMISTFFSTDVAAKDISWIYSLFDDPRSVLFNDNKLVCCYSLSKALDVFKEYSNGMIDFVSDIIRENPTSSEEVLSKFNDSLNKAKEKDHGFIKSLFGGEHNLCENIKIPAALTNIEFIIKFRNEIDNMSTRFITLLQSLSSQSISPLTYEAINLLKNSLTYFTYKMIKKCVDIFENIDNCIHTEISSEDSKKEFQLF